ncbi:MAG: hypothetical protein ACKOD2_11295, partial [Ilumatobacteraceae bacterium]
MAPVSIDSAAAGVVVVVVDGGRVVVVVVDGGRVVATVVVGAALLGGRVLPVTGALVTGAVAGAAVAGAAVTMGVPAPPMLDGVGADVVGGRVVVVAAPGPPVEPAPDALLVSLLVVPLPVVSLESEASLVLVEESVLGSVPGAETASMVESV